jgi:hypothetical protein
MAIDTTGGGDTKQKIQKLDKFDHRRISTYQDNNVSNQVQIYYRMSLPE